MCCGFSCAIYAIIALGLLYLYKIILGGFHHRPPTRPAVSAQRSYKRGSGPIIDCISPHTGESQGKIHSYTPEEVKAAEQRARAAQDEWAKTSFSERRALLQDILDWVIANQNKVIEWSVNDSGKTITEAQLGEVMATCEKIRWLIASGWKYIQREYRPIPFLLNFTKQAYTEWLPLGVVGIIVPWNYPFQNVFAHLCTALLCGNGAVLKVSEFASFSADEMEMVFREKLAARGHNPDLVQIVVGYKETGAALVNCGVDKVLFIGSPAVGKLIMKQASETLTPVILELGGKDPFIVFEDADLQQAVDVALRGAFINCGQNCISSERFYVHKSIKQKFIDMVVAKLKETSVGATALKGRKRHDFGAITMAGQLNIVKRLINDAVSKGAKIVYGGEEIKDPDAPNGRFFSPTVITDVKQGVHEITYEETFGPVMVVMEFETEDEVVELANSTKFGLGSSVFTTDYKRAERMARRIYTGMVNINDFGMVPMIGSLPFGGVKDSGFGCFNGIEGMRGFCRQVSVLTDRFGIRADAPPFVKYPYWASTVPIVQQAVKMVFSHKVSDKIAGLVGFLKELSSAKKQ